MELELEPRMILKKDFLNLKEDHVLFITNPGRMGDEDGSTFLVKEDNGYTLYRIDGWMYPTKEKRNSEDYISLKDAYATFPEWKKAWKNGSNQDDNGKYLYIPMGFGNGLCVDKRIYNDYYPYLMEEIKKKTTEIEENHYDYTLNFSCWLPALANMLEDMNECV